MNKPFIEFLGEKIDPDNMPLLYQKALDNHVELEGQIKSIATAWHNGDIRSAMLALESDLSHG